MGHQYSLSADLSVDTGCAGLFSFLVRFLSCSDCPNLGFFGMGWFPHQGDVPNSTHMSWFGHLTIRPRSITLALQVRGNKIQKKFLGRSLVVSALDCAVCWLRMHSELERTRFICGSNQSMLSSDWFQY